MASTFKAIQSNWPLLPGSTTVAFAFDTDESCLAIQENPRFTPVPQSRQLKCIEPFIELRIVPILERESRLLSDCTLMMFSFFLLPVVEHKDHFDSLIQDLRSRMKSSKKSRRETDANVSHSDDSKMLEETTVPPERSRKDTDNDSYLDDPEIVKDPLTKSTKSKSGRANVSNLQDLGTLKSTTLESPEETTEVSPPALGCKSPSELSFEFGTPDRPILVEDIETLANASPSLLTSVTFKREPQTPIRSELNPTKSSTTSHSSAKSRGKAVNRKSKHLSTSAGKGKASKGKGRLDSKGQAASANVSARKISSYFGVKKEENSNVEKVSNVKPSTSYSSFNKFSTSSKECGNAPDLGSTDMKRSDSGSFKDLLSNKPSTSYGIPRKLSASSKASKPGMLGSAEDNHRCESNKSEKFTKIKQEDVFEEFCSSLEQKGNDNATNDDDYPGNKTKELIQEPPSPSSLDDVEFSMVF